MLIDIKQTPKPKKDELEKVYIQRCCSTLMRKGYKYEKAKKTCQLKWDVTQKTKEVSKIVEDKKKLKTKEKKRLLTPLLLMLAKIEKQTKSTKIQDLITPIPNEIQELKEMIKKKDFRGLPGEQGEQGKQGKRGEKGERGEGGLKGERGLRGLKGERGMRGLRGLQGKKGEKGEQGIPGLNGSCDTPEEIRDKLQSLIGKERLDASAIKNLAQYILPLIPMDFFDERYYKFKRRTVTTDTKTDKDNILEIADTSEPRTITLATRDLNEPNFLIIKDTSGTAAINNITIETEGSETIDGVDSLPNVIDTNYGSIILYPDGENWFSNTGGGRFNLTDRLPATKPTRVREVWDLGDFPEPVGGMIYLEEGKSYILYNEIISPYPFVISPTGRGGIRSAIPGSINFIYVGSGAMFRTSGSGLVSFSLRNILCIGTGSNNFFDVDGVTPSSNQILLMDEMIIVGWASLGNIQNIGNVIFTTANVVEIGGGFTLTDCTRIGIVTYGFANSISSNNTFITVNGSATFLGILNNQPIVLPGESFVDIKPTTNFGSILIDGTVYSKLTGGEFFKSGITGIFTALAQSPITPSKTRVTSLAHGLLNGQKVKIKTDNILGYDGGYEISDITPTTFDIEKVWDGNTDTGIWNTGSLDKTTPGITVKNNGDQPDSRTIGSYFMEDNTIITLISEVGKTNLITKFEKSGGLGDKTTVYSAGHGFINGQTIWIVGTTNYDGQYIISNVTLGTFDIDKKFTEDDATGKAENGWVRIAGITVDGSNIERAKTTDNNEVTFQNLREASGVCTVSTTGEIQIAAANDAEYAVFKNNSRIPNTKISRELTNKRGALSITAPAVFTDGDFFDVRIRNLTSTQNILVRTLQVDIE